MNGRSRSARHDALAMYLRHIDALHHYALIHAAIGETALAHAFTLAAVGLRVLPDRFSWTNSKLEWGASERRPLLRAYHYHGLQHLDRNGPKRRRSWLCVYWR